MVGLRPMTEDEFARYMESSVQAYAQGHVDAGNAEPAEALRFAEADYRRLLPDGVRSPNQHLFSVFEEPSSVRAGMVWVAVGERGKPENAYIYDLQIDPAFQRKGLAREAMLAVERLVTGMGATRIALNVFGYNHGARALYEKLGYGITSIGMMKKLGA